MKPILFSAPMARAILEGRKTQTRRVVKDDLRSWETIPCGRCNGSGAVQMGSTGPNHCGACGGCGIDSPPNVDACPYGKPGDLLWLKESWRTLECYDNLPPRDVPVGSPIWYEATNGPFEPEYGFGKLRPSIFMPRWASRITLRITSVRIERLNEISEDDAIAEGVEINPAYTGIGMDGSPIESPTIDLAPSDYYCALWESLNGPGTFDDRFVWVVEFERVAA